MTTKQAVTPPSATALRTLGIDEFNLAEFPISVLGRYQPVDDDGKKQDTIVYEATTYDRKQRRRISQTVTLTTSRKIGLPTADAEDVILAIAYIGKQTDPIFKQPRIHFAPKAIFLLLGWSGNQDSYVRLASCLKQLRAVSIFYENAWWQNGRRHREFGTGIISDFFLTNEPFGPKASNYRPQSWVVLTEGLRNSIQRRNIRRLDLTRLRSFRAQVTKKAYRFLEKRFYTQQEGVQMSVIDYGRGHLGIRYEKLTDIRREINRSCRELEKVSDERYPKDVGFIAPVTKPKERYFKNNAGEWQIRILPGKLWHAERRADVEDKKRRQSSGNPARDMVLHFYSKWANTRDIEPNTKELKLAATYLTKYGTNAIRLLDYTIRLMKDRFPNAESFGATRTYMAEAAKVAKTADRKKLAKSKKPEEEAGDDEVRRRDAEQVARLDDYWNNLTSDEQQRLEKDALEQARPFLLNKLRAAEHSHDEGRVQLQRKIIVRDHIKVILANNNTGDRDR